jgi:cyclase
MNLLTVCGAAPQGGRPGAGSSRNEARRGCRSRACGAVLLWLGLAAAAFAQHGIEAEPLAENVYLLRGAGANVVAVTTGGGALLVDGGRAEHAEALLEAVASLPGGGPVHTLFNTHWHPEQTGANLALGRAGARIIAHENTRLWMTTDVTRPYEPEVTYGPYPEESHPNDTFYAGGTETIEGVAVQYGYLRQAHTDGDIYVYFPEADVLVVGDAVSGEGWPFVDWWTGGWVGGIAPGIDRLLQVAGDDTVVVPARGGTLGRGDLERQREIFATTYDRLRRLLFSGRGPDEAVAAEPTAEFDVEMGESEEFIRRAFESLWGHHSPDA